MKHRLLEYMKRSAAIASGRRFAWWLGACLLLIGVIANFGTAALRLPDLVPPRPVDGASYYVGAWAMRTGRSPFVWTPELLASAEEERGVSVPATPPASPPLWVWLYQPLASLRFQAAMWAWLALQTLAALWASHMLLRVAGAGGRRALLAVFPFVLTFGPTFLNLTIGQNGIYVLLGALALGRYLEAGGRRSFAAAGGWLVAVAAKIYPLVWLAAPAVCRRRRAAALMLLAFALSFGAMARFYPVANHDYWFDYLRQRGREVTREISVDDQSLSARVLLLGTSNTVWFRGLDTGTVHRKEWRPPAELPPRAARAVTAAVLVLLAAGVVALWFRADRRLHAEGLLYLLVILSLLPIPHMERYNHVTLLAAMAWLWRQGGRYRLLTLLAYSLVGLSRLNHLWALLLSWPAGPLATGTCLYSVFVLAGGIGHRIWTQAGSRTD